MGKNSLNINSRLRFRRELTNSFTNPFDQEIKNCKLFFGDYVYVLQNPLLAGETVDMSETLERNSRSYLNRRKNEDNKTVNVAWDPSDTRVDRIMSMMMFTTSAAGKITPT